VLTRIASRFSAFLQFAKENQPRRVDMALIPINMSPSSSRTHRRLSDRIVMIAPGES